GSLPSAADARCRCPLPRRAAGTGGRRRCRGSRTSGHDPACSSEPSLHLCTACPRVFRAGQHCTRTTRVRRLPAQRTRRDGKEACRIRRPLRRAHELQSRSVSRFGSSFTHVTTHPVSRLPYPGIIRVAHSPDADDAFMFWAMASGKIDTGGRRYVHELADIETLNRRALCGELEVTAVSLHAYAYLADRYALLAHGASIGDRYGPRIVARESAPADPRKALAGRLVAVPGELTTAFLSLRLYQPEARHVVLPF